MELFENMNDQEKKAVEELRMRMKDKMSIQMYKDTLLFYRFLKARKFDINKAEDMLQKHLDFRKVLKYDTILEDFQPKEAFKYINGSYIGEDKEGNSLTYIHANIEVRDVVSCFKTNNYFEHWIWSMEKLFVLLKDVNRKTGRSAYKVRVIFDLEYLRLADVLHPSCAGYASRLFLTYLDNYPESLKRFYVINAPSYYVILYTIIKRILDQEVIRKVSFHGKTGWKEELLKDVDADVLPVFLGGTRTDPDGNPECKTFIHRGGKIPSECRLTKEDRSFKDKSRVEKMTILPRKKHEIFVEIQECDSILEWEFETSSKDILFGLYLKKSEDELINLVPLYKYETPDGTFESSYICQRTGSYVLVFDNTSSWMTAKEVSYCITVNKLKI